MAAPPGRGGQDPARAPGLAAERPYQVSEKSTFLHVGPALDGGLAFPRRQVSAPPASTSTSRSESASTRHSVDSPPSFPTGGAPADPAPEPAPSDSEAAEGEADPQEGEGGAGRRRRNVRRPCKSQRERYRKVKGYLEADVRRDPHGFDFSACYLPPSVSNNAMLCAKLAAGLEEYRCQLISDGAVPVADGASLSLEPLSLPAPGQAMGSRGSPSSSTVPFLGTAFPLRPVPSGQQRSRDSIISL